ncbi:Low-affinity potassium transport [Hyphodiscus hymeniophilus]|uniref:Potassium transport protein n=1 Tax=Hyphodiscus hymeniophilus TaxID=353542 RepID=A0A9P6VEK4_9HELO|nr:Low-affinity potassium transport [Hyphodiscus hymeniophilus]
MSSAVVFIVDSAWPYVCRKMRSLGSILWREAYSLKPSWMSRHPVFNFMSIHYFYLIGWAIVGSLCLYIRGGIAYIDALFFASGAATQSGLNTVNVNNLNTWQQVVLFFMAQACNPITINTFVVFVRLYWFEKRFQHIVEEARRNRQSVARSHTKSRTVERDLGREERGVQGRNIVVMHNTTRTNVMTNDGLLREGSEDDLEKAKPPSQNEKARSSDESEQTGGGESSESGYERVNSNQTHQTQIKFADQVKRSDGLADESLRMPFQRTQEEHIAILQRQRNPDDDTVLRIPGPRDADAGVAPTALAESDDMDRVLSRPESRRDSVEVRALDSDVHTEPDRPRNITIAEPARSPIREHITEDAKAAVRVLDIFRLRKPRILHDHKNHEVSDEIHPTHSRIPTFQSIRSALSRDKEEGIPYLSWEPTIGRNSAFVDLTEEQREELGGIEYRSLKTLAAILITYSLGWTAFGLVGLLPWILKSEQLGSYVEQVGQGRVWWAFFTSSSAFTDLGFTLTPDSMISFQKSTWPLLLMSWLIVIGNTGFPIMLRITIWIMSKVLPRGSGIYEETKFLLDHPRRCFTLLFPAVATWWLFYILVGLNGLDLLFFIVLDLGDKIVTVLPVNYRILDGWFQAVSTRTAGFGVVNLADLHPAIQVSYLIMMYISVLPIAISVRRTNVYEEKSLGVYGTTSDENEDEGEPSYVGAHLRRQLSFDLWYIFAGFFIIAIAEGSRLQSNDPAFSMFAVLFEIVSAYGTVGLSLGYTNIDASFSAEFNVVAKLVIIAMQIRGRHRGLPYQLDRAIILPSEQQQKDEEDMANRGAARRRNSLSTMDRNDTVNSGQTRGDRGRSRSRKGSRASNLLGGLLHPGPTMPNEHRMAPNLFHRRNSRATFASGRDGRSVSPSHIQSAPLDGVKENGRRVEGRRQFYEEGVNPGPLDNAN